MNKPPQLGKSNFQAPYRTITKTHHSDTHNPQPASERAKKLYLQSAEKLITLNHETYIPPPSCFQIYHLSTPPPTTLIPHSQPLDPLRPHHLISSTAPPHPTPPIRSCSLTDRTRLQRSILSFETTYALGKSAFMTSSFWITSRIATPVGSIVAKSISVTALPHRVALGMPWPV